MLPDRFARARIETDGRLIHEQYCRVMEEALCNLQSSDHSARIAGYKMLRGLAETHHCQGVIDPLAPFMTLNAAGERTASCFRIPSERRPPTGVAAHIRYGVERSLLRGQCRSPPPALIRKSMAAVS